jgi:VanZ family protein
LGVPILAELWTFVVQPYAAVALLAAVGVAWPLGRWSAPRRGCSPAAGALFVLCAGLILALTLTPNEPGRYTLLPPHYLTQLNHPGKVWAALTAAPDDVEEYANIVLYVPLGYLGRYFWRSAVAATLFGVAMTVVVETCQYDIVGRAGSLTDIRNNSLGTLLGAVAAAAAIWVVRRRRMATEGPSPATEGSSSPAERSSSEAEGGDDRRPPTARAVSGR